MNLTAKIKQQDAAYFSRSVFRSPLFIMVTAFALLTLVRAVWIPIGFWGVLSVDSKVMGVCLLLVLPGPFVLALRLRRRVGEKLLALGDDDLRSDIGHFCILAPFYAYFGVFLALEIAFLTLRHW
jgi:hypothetical protein